MTWRRGKGGKQGRLIRVSYGFYDHTGHLSKFDKLWINRKERKARKPEATSVRTEGQ